MFGFLFKYTMKEILRNKSAMFWGLVFPFILSTVYGLILSGVDDKNTKNPVIPVMVEDQNYREIFRQIEISGESLFEIKDYEDPEKYLKEGEIDGYLRGKGEEVELVVKRQSINTTILHNITNSISRSYKAFGEIMKNPENANKIEELIRNFSENGDIRIKDGMNGNNKRRMVSYFYSLLAMICLGSMSFGVNVVEASSPISDVKEARRRSVSPIGRGGFIFPDFAATTVITSSNTLILYAYIRYVLGVEFGNDRLKLIFGLLLGNLMATLLGMLLALVIKGKSENKIMISAAFYVLSSSLSGMMVSNLAGFLSHRLPIINYINPGTVLTKMFTSLYLYRDPKMYLMYVVNILTIMGVALICIPILIRRRNYDSI